MSIRNVDHLPSSSYIEQIEKYTRGLLKENLGFKSNLEGESKIQDLICELDLFYQDFIDVPEDLCRKIKIELEGKILNQRKHENQSRVNFLKYSLGVTTFLIVGFYLYWFLRNHAAAPNSHKGYLPF